MILLKEEILPSRLVQNILFYKRKCFKETENAQRRNVVKKTKKKEN